MRARELVLVLGIGCVAPVGADVATDDTAGGGGGGTTNGGGGGNGGGGNGGGACPDVCWTWNEPEPVAPVGVGGTFTVDVCDQGGLEEGVCPDGFTCGASRRIPLGPTVRFEVPVCEGDGGPYTLVADLSPPPTLGDGMPVTLRFSLAGEAWPGGGEEGDAGKLILTPVAGGEARTVDLPRTRDGRLDLELPEGVYTAVFTTPGDDSRWPHVGRTGRLVVRDEGEAEVDVEAYPVSVDVVVDGDIWDVLPDGLASWALKLVGETTGTISRNVVAGGRVDAPLVLPPDTYTVSFTGYRATAASPYPSGGLQLAAPLAVEDGPAALRIDVDTVEVGGLVKLDGATPPSTHTYGVGWSNTFGATSFDAKAGRFAGRVWPGTYDVAVDLRPTYLPASVPRGIATVAKGIAPTKRDFAVTTARAEGVVTLRGAQPKGSYRGNLRFVAADGSWSELALDNYGDAGFDGVALAGVADVWVDGDGKTLPTDTPVATGLRPRTGMALDVDAVAVDVTLTVNGRAVQGDGRTLQAQVGLIPLEERTGEPKVDPTTPSQFLSTWLVAPYDGPVQVKGFVAPGTYRVDVYGLGGAFPLGQATLVDEVVIDRAWTRTFDVRAVDLSVELLLDGEVPPAATGGGDRGVVGVMSTQLRVPASGRARVSTKVMSGTLLYSIGHTCVAEDDCTVALPRYTTLFAWLEP